MAFWEVHILLLTREHNIEGSTCCRRGAGARVPMDTDSSLVPAKGP